MAAQDTTEVSAESGNLLEPKTIEKGKEREEREEKGKEREEKDKEKIKDPDKEKGKEKDSDKKSESEKEKLKGLEGANLDALLQRLPGSVSRDLVDQLTVIIPPVLPLFLIWC